MKSLSHIFFLLLATPLAGHAGEPALIELDRHVANCENQWFAAEGNDGKTPLGFAYVDPDAGPTIEHYGFLETSDGKLRAVAAEFQGKARLIQRIEQNFPAHCLTDLQARELGLPSAPESMKHYEDKRPPGKHHAMWAYFYNHIGASDVAMDHVSKAMAAGHSSPALTFEHAFALNVLERFDEAIALLQPLVDTGQADADIIAELAYAFLMQNKLPKAIELFKQAVDHGGGVPSSRRPEFARNIAAAYEQLGDKKQRDEWLERAERLQQSEEARKNYEK